MKEFIEKLIGRLEEIYQSQIEKYTEYLCEEPLVCIYDRTDIENTKVKTTYEIIQIVNQLAEEYNNDFCDCGYDEFEEEWQTGCGVLFELHDSNREIMHYCPYCGKKIKVVEPKGE